MPHPAVAVVIVEDVPRYPGCRPNMFAFRLDGCTVPALHMTFVRAQPTPECTALAVEHELTHLKGGMHP